MSEPQHAPYTPTADEWSEIWDMVCAYCAHAFDCRIVEAMIAHAKDGAPWPEGGWVSDPGSGATCLSYEPGRRPPLPRGERRRIARTPEAELPPVCAGCAARKGSEASVSLHTRRDYRAAVRQAAPFLCHERLPAEGERPRQEHYCGGWCRALKTKGGRRS